MPVRSVRRRYIKFKVESPHSVDKRYLFDAVVDSVSRLYGVKGLSEASLRLIEYEGNEGIIRCSHLQLNRVRSAFAMISHIGGEVAAVHTIKTSGTLRSL